MKPFSPEQEALKARAQEVWRRRGLAKLQGQPLHEPGLTQIMLQDLKATYPGTVEIMQFSPTKEGENGADWAWAFVNQAGTLSMPMYVQAKVLDAKDIDYREIRRTVGRPKAGKPLRRQIDVLIEAARDEGWPAVYAFYNHLSNLGRIPPTCETMANPDVGLTPETWGISIADAYRVRAALNDLSFDTHSRHSLPLHCLLCSHATGLRDPDGTPADMLGALRRLRDLGGKRPSDGAPLPTAPLPGLPDLFRQARRVERTAEGPEKQRRMIELKEDHPNLAGVAIFQDGPRRD